MTDDSPDFGQPETETPPAPAPDAFGLLSDLVRLMADPAAVRSKLDELKSTTVALEHERATMADARAAHDVHVAETTAALAKRQKEVDEYYKGTMGLRADVETREQYLAKTRRDIERLDVTLRKACLRYHNELGNYNEALQHLPNWTEVDRIISTAVTVHDYPAPEPTFQNPTPVFRVDSDDDNIDDNTRPAHWGGQPPRIPVSAEVADRALDKIAAHRPKRHHHRSKRRGRAAAAP